MKLIVWFLSYGCLAAAALVHMLKLQVPPAVVVALTEPLPRLILYFMIYFIANMDATLGVCYVASLVLLDWHVYDVLNFEQPRDK